MTKFFQPLVIFIMGNLGLLLVFLFFPALGDAQTQLQADTATYASDFWGWSWAVTSVKLAVFLIFEGLILFAVGKSILGLKK